MNSEGWDQYKKLVINELERNYNKLESIEKRLNNIEEKLTVINTKIYVAAFIASAVITSMVQYAFGTI